MIGMRSVRPCPRHVGLWENQTFDKRFNMWLDIEVRRAKQDLTGMCFSAKEKL